MSYNQTKPYDNSKNNNDNDNDSYKDNDNNNDKDNDNINFWSSCLIVCEKKFSWKVLSLVLLSGCRNSHR